MYCHYYAVVGFRHDSPSLRRIHLYTQEGLSMIYDIQKASTLKRISAWMLDTILLIILVTGIAALLSGLTNYDSYNERLLASYDRIEQQYGVDFDITQEELGALTEEEKQQYDDAFTALSEDEEAIYVYNMLINLSLTITSVSILLAYVVTEMAIPLLLGNGQTVGKKIFGLAVMRSGGVKINTVCLFIRTILGKYTIGTMIPVLIVIMLIFGTVGVVGTAIAGAVVLIQIILMIATPNNCTIHDILADTVVVDFSSQMIFNSPEDRTAYMEKYAAEQSSRDRY